MYQRVEDQKRPKATASEDVDRLCEEALESLLLHKESQVVPPYWTYRRYIHDTNYGNFLS